MFTILGGPHVSNRDRGLILMLYDFTCFCSYKSHDESVLRMIPTYQSAALSLRMFEAEEPSPRPAVTIAMAINGNHHFSSGKTRHFYGHVQK